MQSRTELVGAVQERHGLDALIAWAPEEIVMLTGSLPHWGLSVAVVPAGDVPVLFIPELEPEPTLPDGWQLETYRWGEFAGEGGLLEKITRLASGGRMGWKGSQSRGALPGNFAEVPPWPADWPHCLPGKRCDAAVDDLLAIKTDSDVSALRLTHRVAKMALQTFRAAVEPGRTEAEIGAQVEAAVHRRTGYDGIQVSRAWASVQSGPQTANSGRFNRSSGRRIRSGERVLIELAVCVNGYWADLTESILCGDAPEEAPLCEIIRAASAAAVSVMRPGVTGAEVDRAAREVIRKAGYAEAFTHATGHPVGFRYHDAGPMLAPGSTGILAEGMVLTVEPGLYLAEEGARIEQNALITCDGAQVLSALP